jgi:NADPH:quinone reductase
MKALRSHSAGGPDTLSLDEVPAPLPGPGEVVIAVKACGINFLDTLVIRDLYQTRPTRPFAPGVEVAGLVTAVGEGVSSWSVGERVIALPDFGGFAEAALVKEDRVFALPEAISFARGAALPIAYGTAIYALRDRADIRPGETMIVLGASGGAGLAAVELGKALGLTVIGAVSSPEKAEAVRAAGARDVVIYPRGNLDRDAARALTQAYKAAVAKVSGADEGADIIYDCIGGDFAEPAIRSLAWGGRYLTIGFAAGIPSIPLNLTLLKSIDIRGVFYGAFSLRDPARNTQLCEELIDLAATGKVAADEPTAFPLARGGEAIAELAERRSIGKVVVMP